MVLARKFFTLSAVFLLILFTFQNCSPISKSKMSGNGEAYEYAPTGGGNDGTGTNDGSQELPGGGNAPPSTVYLICDGGKAYVPHLELKQNGNTQTIEIRDNLGAVRSYAWDPASSSASIGAQLSDGTTIKSVSLLNSATAQVRLVATSGSDFVELLTCKAK